MTDSGTDAPSRSGYSDFKRISLGEDWFEVYEIAADLFAFHEPRHYEGTIVNLVIGEGQAEFREIVDPWNRRLRQYSFGRAEILTRW